jgi:hypothetical protein
MYAQSGAGEFVNWHAQIYLVKGMIMEQRLDIRKLIPER